jgi:nicotinamidase-related amidase
MSVPASAWLVVIDMQEVFADPASEWATPRFGEAAAGIARLLPAFRDRTVFTRFVAPEHPSGSWVPYYRRWPFALAPQDARLWRITDELAVRDAPVVTAPTFGKWNADLAAAVGSTGDLVLAGVSTDCCVLSTALAAADAGCTVHVVADACAGVTDADHDRAVAAMALYEPLIRITSTAEVLSAPR